MKRAVGATYKRKGQKLGKLRVCRNLSLTKWLSYGCAHKNSHQIFIKYRKWKRIRIIETSLPVLSRRVKRECLENMKHFPPSTPRHGSQERDLVGGILNVLTILQ